MQSLWRDADGRCTLFPTETERVFYYGTGDFGGDCRHYLRRLIGELDRAVESDKPLTSSTAKPIQGMARVAIDAIDADDLQKVGWMMFLIGEQVRMLRDYEAGHLRLEAMGREYRETQSSRRKKIVPDEVLRRMDELSRSCTKTAASRRVAAEFVRLDIGERTIRDAWTKSRKKNRE